MDGRLGSQVMDKATTIHLAMFSVWRLERLVLTGPTHR